MNFTECAGSTYENGGLATKLEYAWLEVLGSFCSEDAPYTIASGELTFTPSSYRINGSLIASLRYTRQSLEKEADSDSWSIERLAP